jgi:para-aminobenzoate synthetase component 1
MAIPGSAMARAILRLAGDAPRAFAWLDGGAQGRSFFGIEADREIEVDSLAALAAIEALWRAEPGYVWIGWISYDLGVDALLERPARAGSLPGLCFRRFRAAIEIEGERVVWHGEAAASGRLAAALAAAHAASTRDAQGEPCVWPFGHVSAAMSVETYAAAVAWVLEKIAAGETYQVNLSQRLSAGWLAEPGGAAALARAAADAYSIVRASTPASMGALLAAEGAWILSNSPETLIDVRFGGGADGGDLARTWPIKGTRPRGRGAAEDAAAGAALLASVKDRAEHLMIVDLLRNDLGALAIPGSVSAPRTPTLVSLPTVHHLVSEVRCTLRPGWRLESLWRAIFPGGSITGAPKRRTVELIEAVEGRTRGIYCGAIVALEPGGLRASIPIRTAMVDRGGLTLDCGGGVVADSDPEEERLETLAKARAFDRGLDGRLRAG